MAKVGADLYRRRCIILKPGSACFWKSFLKFSFCSFALLFITYLRYRKWSKRAKGKVSDKKIWIFSGFGRFQKKSKGLLWPRLFRAAAFAPWGHRAPVERLMPPMARAKKKTSSCPRARTTGGEAPEPPPYGGWGADRRQRARARARALSTKSNMSRTKIAPRSASKIR